MNLCGKLHGIETQIEIHEKVNFNEKFIMLMNHQSVVDVAGNKKHVKD